MLKISPDSQLLTAHWLLPVAAPPIKDGALVVTKGRIDFVGSVTELTDSCGPAQLQVLFERKTDYANALIVPGLINLHTHLDYSFAPGLPAGHGIFPWMKALVQAGAAQSEAEWQAAALAGACQSALAATTCLVDSSFTGTSLNALAEVGLRGVVALELFGGNEERAPGIWQQWLEKRRQRLATASTPAQAALARKRLLLTVAPHAPYTVSPRLWHLAHEWALSEGLPITAHVAESKQEWDWIKAGNAELDEYLAFIRALYAGGASTLKEYDYLKEARATGWKGHGLSPVQHLHEHGLLGENLLAVHCVHVDQADIGLLARQRSGIAHCPRSNQTLGVGRAPWPQLLEACGKVGFGTDSLASNDDLNLINEVNAAQIINRSSAAAFTLTATLALEALTLRAAQAIGLGHQIGSLTPGKRADLAVFPLKSARADESPLSQLFDKGAAVLDLFVDGERIVQNGRLVKPGLCVEV